MPFNNEQVDQADNNQDNEIYRYAFEQSALPILVSRLVDGLILDINPAFERWSEVERDRVIGKTSTTDHHWFSPTERKKLIEEFLSRGSNGDKELVINLGARGKRFCKASARLFRINDKETLVTTYLDITDERERQLEVEASERHLQTLADLETLLFQQTDPDRVLTTSITFLRERLDADRAWLLTPCDPTASTVRITYLSQLPDYAGITDNQPIPVSDEFQTILARHLDTDEPISYGPQQDFGLPQFTNGGWQIRSRLVVTLRPATGDPWLLGLHQCSHARNWNENDKRLLKSIALRITDRLNSLLLRNDLERSEQRYRDLFESAPEAIVIFDTDTGSVLSSNPAASTMLGYSANELAGKSVLEFSSPLQAGGVSTQQRVEELTAQAVSGQSARVEWHYEKSDGTPVLAEVVLKKLAGSDNFLRVTAIDITERRQLEAQLLQAQKMESIGQLAGGIAHDFNNLLQGILGFSDLLIANPESSDIQRRQLNHIHDAATRAATLTRQLLAFGRRQVLDKKNIDLNALIADEQEVIQRMLGSHIEYDFIPGRNLGTVYSDAVQLEQILLNLYLNARDAMPNGGLLTTETEAVLITGEYCRTHPWAKPGRYVMISVSDNGEGMDSDTLGKIFEPFFTTKAVGGSGLGLAMAYGIVQQHDGMIQAYSEPGLGTTFKIYLPQSERQANLVGPKITESTAGGGETILVAEDDPAIMELVRTILENVGYTVLEAKDGHEAVAQYRYHGDAIDLVLLDVIMPRLGGKQAFEQIRALNPDIRCLFTSGYSNNGVHTGFVLTEGLTLIQKPHKPSDLLRQIRQLLDDDST